MHFSKLEISHIILRFLKPSSYCSTLLHSWRYSPELQQCDAHAIHGFVCIGLQYSSSKVGKWAAIQ